MEALGPVLIILSLPLVFRFVPRNRLYGFRVAATLRNDWVWYEVNALWGRHALLLGVLMVAVEFVLPVALRTPVLWTIAGVGFTAITIHSWRIANRLDRERLSSRTTRAATTAPRT
jgi:hypothetical protein